MDIREPLGIIGFGRSEQSIQRVVSRNDKARKVGQKLTSIVKEDQEEVDKSEASDDVDLGSS